MLHQALEPDHDHTEGLRGTPEEGMGYRLIILRYAVAVLPQRFKLFFPRLELAFSRIHFLPDLLHLSFADAELAGKAVGRLVLLPLLFQLAAEPFQMLLFLLQRLLEVEPGLADSPLIILHKAGNRFFLTDEQHAARRNRSRIPL